MLLLVLYSLYIFVMMIFFLQIRNSDESQAINFLTEVTGIGWVQIPHVHVCTA